MAELPLVKMPQFIIIDSFKDACEIHEEFFVLLELKIEDYLLKVGVEEFALVLLYKIQYIFSGYSPVCVRMHF